MCKCFISTHLFKPNVLLFCFYILVRATIIHYSVSSKLRRRRLLSRYRLRIHELYSNEDLLSTAVVRMQIYADIKYQDGGDNNLGSLRFSTETLT